MGRVEIPGLDLIKAQGKIITYEANSDILYSLNLFTYAIGASFLFVPMSQLENQITEGTLDQYLTKPWNPLFLIVSSKYNLAYISHITLATVILRNR